MQKVTSIAFVKSFIFRDAGEKHNLWSQIKGNSHYSTAVATKIILVASTVFKEVREDHEVYDVTIDNEEVSKQE